MALPAPFNWNIHPGFALQINKAQQSAESFDGYCVWPFSQVLNPVKNIIGTHGNNNTRTCELLAAKWLEQHAKGSSIINWLTNGDGEKIDAGKIRQLLQLSAVGRGNAGETQHQPHASEAWLRCHGLVWHRQLTGGALPGENNDAVAGQTYSRTSLTNHGDFSKTIARQIVQSPGSYKMLLLQGSSGVHAMTAWSDRDVSFFDPSYGEFWFPHPSDFVAWLPKFWRVAGYDSPAFGLSGIYAIQEYSMPCRNVV